MKRDRTKICNVISQMLDNPNEIGIYSTSKAFKALEIYIEQERFQAVGWAYAEACVIQEKGEDIRKLAVPDFVDRSIEDLDIPLEKDK